MKRRAPGLAALLTMGLLVAPPAEARSVVRPYDFDGNGHPDLAVGAPGLRVNAVRDTGGVVILPASSRGLSMREKVISQSSRGLSGASETGDQFGAAVTSADFDRDGFADLAVGQPGESAGTIPSAGAVTVVYGSARGLDTRRSAGFGSPSGAEESARFGSALVAGDFDRDGYPDLAVGAPGAEMERSGEADFGRSGTVTVMSGGPRGLTSAGAVTLRHENDLAFGAELAAGDLDQDGVTDLVVGARGQMFVHEDGFRGSVSYCAGRPGGPNACNRLLEANRLAGMTSLVVGNMSGSARPEVVAGASQEVEDNGGYLIILQLASGNPLTVDRELMVGQDTEGIPGTERPGEGFGDSLAIGDIDRDGYADLAVGAADDEIVGRVTVVHGDRSGWRTSGNYVFDQNTAGIPGRSETLDAFGAAVTLLDHNRDGRLDLTIGAGRENDNAGAITTLRGSGTRFTTSGSRTFGLATLGYAYPAGARFGSDLGR